jgi:small subunit ribosomal protein S8
MIITSNVSNLFSKIVNGSLVGKFFIKIQKSKKLVEILNILNKEGYIKGFEVKQDILIIFLKYIQNKPVITKITSISKPGKRFYVKNKNVFKLQGNLYILSTSKGLLTNVEAKKINIGGELICQIH